MGNFWWWLWDKTLWSIKLLNAWPSIYMKFVDNRTLTIIFIVLSLTFTLTAKDSILVGIFSEVKLNVFQKCGSAMVLPLVSRWGRKTIVIPYSLNHEPNHIIQSNLTWNRIAMNWCHVPWRKLPFWIAQYSPSHNKAITSLHVARLGNTFKVCSYLQGFLFVTGRWCALYYLSQHRNLLNASYS